MPAFSAALAPVVEHIAELLAASSPYDVKVPTVLSGEKHRAAARRRVATQPGNADPPASLPARGPGVPGLAPRGKRRRKPTTVRPLPAATCRGCGAALPVETQHGYANPRTSWCARCLVERREEVAEALPAAARVAAERFAEATGTLPTHTDNAKTARADANRRQRVAEIDYEAQHDSADELERYHIEIQPRLVRISLVAIARACGVSTSAASKWRRGDRTPHPRHWAALAELVGLPVDAEGSRIVDMA
jgi:hypothetical protein